MKISEVKNKLSAFCAKYVTLRNVSLGVFAIALFAAGFAAANIGDRHRGGRGEGRHNAHFAGMDGRGKGMRGGDPAKRIENRVQHMKEKLGLSETQVQQITKILTDDQARVKAQWEARKQAMKSDTGKTRPSESDIKQFKAQREAVDQQIAAVLTSDQRTKYDSMKVERGGRKGGRKS